VSLENLTKFIQKLRIPKKHVSLLKNVKGMSRVDWNSSSESKAAYVNDFKWFSVQVKG